MGRLVCVARRGDLCLADAPWRATRVASYYYKITIFS